MNLIVVGLLAFILAAGVSFYVRRGEFREIVARMVEGKYEQD